MLYENCSTESSPRPPPNVEPRKNIKRTFSLKVYKIRAILASDAGGHQLGRIEDYEAFLNELDRAWRECERVLVPGGRICCVIGDILIPRRADGRHRVLPLPSDIQVRSRNIGLDNLTPILWFKIGNRTNESGGGSSGYYGKPYQPGAIIKNDHEHILMLRKPGGYRTTPMVQKALSMHCVGMRNQFSKSRITTP
jgi:DNA modification methylase